MCSITKAKRYPWAFEDKGEIRIYICYSLPDFIEHALYILLFPGDQMIVMVKYIAISSSKYGSKFI